MSITSARMGNVFVMAGIPRVMQGMFDAVKHDLKGGRPMLSRTVSCHLPEGVIAKGLGEAQSRYPDLDIGSYPSTAAASSARASSSAAAARRASTRPRTR